jgi:hypothetical protein
MNPHKGDVSFEVGGTTYVLRYSHRSLVLLENELGKSLIKIMREIDGWKANPEDMRLGTICALLWAGLQRHQPNMTVEEATDLLDDIDGGASAMIDIIGEAFQRAFSAPGTKGTNPPKRVENGSGTISSSSTSAMDSTQTSSGISPQEN